MGQADRGCLAKRCYGESFRFVSLGRSLTEAFGGAGDEDDRALQKEGRHRTQQALRGTITMARTNKALFLAATLLVACEQIRSECRTLADTLLACKADVSLVLTPHQRGYGTCPAVLQLLRRSMSWSYVLAAQAVL